jgi:hypothetical protein
MARWSFAVATATRRQPLPRKKPATALPTLSCEKPTTVSTGRSVMSQVSITGMPRRRRRSVEGPCASKPATTIASTRRPTMVSSSADSRARS